MINRLKQVENKDQQLAILADQVHELTETVNELRNRINPNGFFDPRIISDDYAESAQPGGERIYPEEVE